MKIESLNDENRTTELDIPAKGKSLGSGSGTGTARRAESKKKKLQKKAKKTKNKLKNIDEQIELAENEGDWLRVIELQTEAQGMVLELVDAYCRAGYDEDSDEVLSWLNKGYDYAGDQSKTYSDLWERLTDSIEALRDSVNDANTLLEKQQAVADAEAALETARNERTVRVYNGDSGQWEWVADEKAVSDAEAKLTKAETAYYKESLKQELNALKSDGTIKSILEAGDLSGITIGPAITRLIEEYATDESAAEAAAALGSLSSVTEYVTGGEYRTQFNSGDSHDTNYYFPGGITITADQAQGMTLADLAAQLQVLGVT